MADIVYPYTKFRYRLEIDGIDAGGFSADLQQFWKLPV